MMTAGNQFRMFEGFALRAGRSRNVVALGLLLLVSMAAPAHAQINPFGTYRGPVMSAGDYKEAGQVVVKLLNEKPATVGNSAAWNNPQSGNSGTFTIDSLFTKDGMPCRTVTAHVNYARASGQYPRGFSLNACQLPDGQWKVAS